MCCCRTLVRVRGVVRSCRTNTATAGFGFAVMPAGGSALEAARAASAAPALARMLQHSRSFYWWVGVTGPRSHAQNLRSSQEGDHSRKTR